MNKLFSYKIASIFALKTKTARAEEDLKSSVYPYNNSDSKWKPDWDQLDTNRQSYSKIMYLIAMPESISNKDTSNDGHNKLKRSIEKVRDLIVSGDHYRVSLVSGLDFKLHLHGIYRPILEQLVHRILDYNKCKPKHLQGYLKMADEGLEEYVRSVRGSPVKRLDPSYEGAQVDGYDYKRNLAKMNFVFQEMFHRAKCMDSPAVVACILPVNFIKFAVIRLLQLQLDSFGRFEIEEGSITKVVIHKNGETNVYQTNMVSHFFEEDTSINNSTNSTNDTSDSKHKSWKDKMKSILPGKKNK